MENGRLLFGRKIYEGIGNRLYGLEVAEHIVENDEFLGLARKVRKQLLNVEEEIVSTKKSIYNKDLYVNECGICKKTGELEVHHINSQKFADCDGSIDYFNKNNKGNLVVLCHEHHGGVHKGEIELNGWVETLEGRRLDWKERKEENKIDLKEKKEQLLEVKVHLIEKSEGISEEMRERVKGYFYLTKNLSMRVVKEKIRKDLGINLSLVQMRGIFKEIE
jgi:hypothetical protein